MEIDEFKDMIMDSHNVSINSKYKRQYIDTPVQIWISESVKECKDGLHSLVLCIVNVIGVDLHELKDKFLLFIAPRTMVVNDAVVELTKSLINKESVGMLVMTDRNGDLIEKKKRLMGLLPLEASFVCVFLYKKQTIDKEKRVGYWNLVRYKIKTITLQQNNEKVSIKDTFRFMFHKQAANVFINQDIVRKFPVCFTDKLQYIKLVLHNKEYPIVVQQGKPFEVQVITDDDVEVSKSVEFYGPNKTVGSKVAEFIIVKLKVESVSQNKTIKVWFKTNLDNVSILDDYKPSIRNNFMNSIQWNELQPQMEPEEIQNVVFHQQQSPSPQVLTSVQEEDEKAEEYVTPRGDSEKETTVSKEKSLVYPAYQQINLASIKKTLKSTIACFEAAIWIMFTPKDNEEFMDSITTALNNIVSRIAAVRITQPPGKCLFMNQYRNILRYRTMLAATTVSKFEGDIYNQFKWVEQNHSAVILVKPNMKFPMLFGRLFINKEYLYLGFEPRNGRLCISKSQINCSIKEGYLLAIDGTKGQFVMLNAQIVRDIVPQIVKTLNSC